MLKPDATVIAAVFIAGMLAGAISAFIVADDWWEAKAIEQGFGFYCPADAKFVWIGQECVEVVQ